MDQKYYKIGCTTRVDGYYPQMMMADGCQEWNVYDKLTNHSLIEKMADTYCNDFYVVVWNTDTPLALGFDGQVITAPVNSLLCIPPRRLVKWVERPCDGFLTFVFSASLFNRVDPELMREARLMLFDTVRVVGQVNAHDQARLKGLAEETRDEIAAHGKDECKLRRMQLALLSYFLAKLMDIREREMERDSADARSNSRQLCLYLRFAEFVETHYTQNLSMPDFVKALGVSRSVLYRSVARVTGCTPMAMMRQRRMDEAKRLLCERDVSVTDIAKRLGFRKLVRFDQFFTSVMGVSPSDYREMVR